MKGCQNARCNTKYIKKFVFEYQEVFFTHREPIVILKGSQKARIYSAVGKVKTERNFPDDDNVLYIFNPSTP